MNSNTKWSAIDLSDSSKGAPALAIYADPGHYSGIEEGTPKAKRRSLERWWLKYKRPSDPVNISASGST